MNSVGLQFARAVKVWLRDAAPLSFTHRALQSSFGQTVLTPEDRQMGSGAFRIFFSSFFLFFSFLFSSLFVVVVVVGSIQDR